MELVDLSHLATWITCGSVHVAGESRADLCSEKVECGALKLLCETLECFAKIKLAKIKQK